MNRARLILILGVWVAVLPYLGFPVFWKNILFSLTGLGFIYFAYVLYEEFKISIKDEPRVFDNFSENNTFNSNMNDIKNEQ